MTAKQKRDLWIIGGVAILIFLLWFFTRKNVGANSVITNGAGEPVESANYTYNIPPLGATTGITSPNFGDITFPTVGSGGSAGACGGCSGQSYQTSAQIAESANAQSQALTDAMQNYINNIGINIQSGSILDQNSTYTLGNLISGNV